MGVCCSRPVDQSGHFNSPTKNPSARLMGSEFRDILDYIEQYFETSITVLDNKYRSIKRFDNHWHELRIA